MILTVDVGNTNIKVGAWNRGNLAFVSTIQTNRFATSDEYAAKLLDTFQLYSFNSTQFDGAIVSSVVPQITNNISFAIQRVIRVPKVIIVSPGLKTGLNIKIDDPATLGSDMVCSGVATIAKYELPAIILSLGTATAMFAINEKAEFLGGTLSPGLGISLEALSSRAAQLPHISLDQPKEVIGTNTVDSMTSGVMYGHACMIDGLIRKMGQELGTDKPTVIASGGIAPVLIPLCEEKIILNDNLVLEGLKIIYNKNIK